MEKTFEDIEAQNVWGTDQLYDSAMHSVCDLNHDRKQIFSTKNAWLSKKDTKERKNKQTDKQTRKQLQHLQLIW